MSYYPNSDYNSCISITILPTVIAVLTQVPSEYVFKITFQLLFAFTPVMVFIIARRYLSVPLAFLASFLLISQTWFYEQMPALVRQETAFIFYLLTVMVLFDERLESRGRYILFAICTAALIMSHYTTAYVWLTLLFGGFALSYLYRFFVRNTSVKTGSLQSILFVLSISFLLLWEVSITQTGSTLTSVATRGGSESTVALSTAANVPPELIGSVTPALLPGEQSSGQTGGLLNTVRSIFLMDTNNNSDSSLLQAQRNAIIIFVKTHGAKYLYKDANATGYTPMIIKDGAKFASVVPNFFHK